MRVEKPLRTNFLIKKLAIARQRLKNATYQMQRLDRKRDQAYSDRNEYVCAELTRAW